MFYKLPKSIYFNMKQTTFLSTALFRQYLSVGLPLVASLNSFGLQVQTTSTLPAACDNCPPPPTGALGLSGVVLSILPLGLLPQHKSEWY
jgi:hypothetical protein